MLHKIDYVSYTFYAEDDTHDEDWTPSHEYLRRHLPAYIDTSGEQTIAPHRYGFVFGVAFDNHTYVWVSVVGLFLVEHTGAGCDLLQDRGMLLSLIHERADNLTRIDIATDMLTDERPADFANHRTGAKTSAVGYQKSNSGETVYVGSRKSERTCKVYRYDGNHPRAAWLRVEYTYKGHNAKIVARMLKNGDNVHKIAIASGTRYGWKSSAWRELRRGFYNGNIGI